MLNQPDGNERIQTEERLESLSRRYRWLGIGGVLLATAILFVAWYGFEALTQDNGALGQLPAVQQTVATLSDRAKETDAKLTGSSAEQHRLADQFAKLSQSVGARLDTAKKQAEQRSTEMFQRLEQRVSARVDGKLQAVDSRLARVESSGDAGQTRIAQLQRELGQVKREMAQQADQLGSVKRQLQDSGARQEHQLASLRDGQELTRRNVNGIEKKLAVRCVDFEITKNHNRELAPGISLELTGTDIAYRRVKGWMWIMPDRRTIWLRNTSAQEPIVFYGYQDGKKRELVITNVTKNGASGYLLLPVDTTDVAQSASE